MKYVLDTTAVSALMHGKLAARTSLDHAGKSDVFLAQPVLAELAYGIAKLPPSRKRQHLQEKFDLVRGEFARVAWSDEVSERYGEIRAYLEKRGEPLDDFDLAIAAHALAIGATLVSANVAHMQRIPGLRVEDWK